MLPRSAAFVMALILLAAHPLTAQTNLDAWYQHKLNQDREAMYTLLSWATASTIIGTTFLITGRNHFGLMSASWGIINGAISGYALLSAPRPGSVIAYDTALRDEKRLRTILLVNSALNVGYVATGAAMWRYGDSRRYQEYGAAIVGQGVFLMIFDATYLVLVNRRLENLQLLPASTGIGASLRYTF